MATAAAKPEIFTRKSSGLVRVMSPYSAFIYNILTMGLIFPWTYLWAPGALPGGRLVWGILLAMIFEIPIALTYVWLSTALPRSGGDYVFQSRVFGGGVGFSIVMSGFVIWILQWVALSGWLLSYLGFASLFLGLGGTMGNPTLTSIGVWFTTPWGIIIVSILNALLAMLLLVSGFKNYVKFQYVMWYATLLSFGIMLYLFFTATPESFAQKLDAFVVASGGAPNFYETAIGAAKAANIDLNPPFSLLATLLVAPIAWTSLQWATYSAQQNGEIKGARSLQQPAGYHPWIADRDGFAAGSLGGGLRARHRHRLPLRCGGRLLGGIGGRQVQRRLSLAEHRGHGARWQPDHRGAHRPRLHPQRLPDRQQLLYRHDPRDGGHVARSPVAGMGEPGLRPPAHAGQRPYGVLSRQHPGDPRLQFVGPVDGADAWASPSPAATCSSSPRWPAR